MGGKAMKPAERGDRFSRKPGRLTEHYRSKKAGLPPGSLVHIGTRGAQKVTISALDYGENEFQEKDISNFQDLAPYLESRETTWIRVQGLQQTDVIESVGSFCKVHPLFLEDIVNTSQRPKAENAGGEAGITQTLRLAMCLAAGPVIRSTSSNDRYAPDRISS